MSATSPTSVVFRPLRTISVVEVAREVKRQHGPASVVTAANCFAHIEDVHATVDGIVEMLKPSGVFVSESHYLISLLDTLQYDTVYHEHLRYYSLASLKHLLDMHGLEVFHARPIPSHGGSIRVYAARRGRMERAGKRGGGCLPPSRAAKPWCKRLASFQRDVVLSKLRLMSMLRDLKESGARIVGISAPSRASTLINYVGLDEGIIDYVCEIAGSLKIGKCMPGTGIPVVDEPLFSDQPDCAVIFSWHIADELAPKLRAKGFRGRLIAPLPVPRSACRVHTHERIAGQSRRRLPSSMPTRRAPNTTCLPRRPMRG